MKKIIFILLFISFAFCEKEITLIPKTDSVKLILFYTNKLSRCSNKRCLFIRGYINDYIEELPDSIFYGELEIADNRKYADSLKIEKVPSLVLYNKENQEIGRLEMNRVRCPQIDSLLIEKKLIDSQLNPISKKQLPSEALPDEDK